ncbi:hypothetical protein HRI_003980700 [Hibiscus trionum]|uniref:Uncharacterized protein n=1 Tax=Hibiscus trionum TaxID=183268 RepID=A0A9W7MKL9_HIBTR|nr:hypothetical protein HRI_003980700 [Hibiscus trionum]
MIFSYKNPTLPLFFFPHISLSFSFSSLCFLALAYLVFETGVLAGYSFHQLRKWNSKTDTDRLRGLNSIAFSSILMTPFIPLVLVFQENVARTLKITWLKSWG